MKKSIAVFLFFIIHTLTGWPVWAANVQGCGGSVMQGCSSVATASSGPTSPFLINEDFSVDPVWTETGNSNVVSGESVNITTAGSNDFTQTPLFAQGNELWSDVDVKIDTGFAISTNGHSTNIYRFSDSGGSSRLTLDLINDSGTLKFRTRIRNDAGTDVTVTHGSPTVPINSVFTVSMRFLNASTAVSSDGGGQIWIDSTLIRDSLDIDNFDTSIPDQIRMGFDVTDTSVAGTLRIDNVRVSPTGNAP